jgi:hypothetical protein
LVELITRRELSKRAPWYDRQVAVLKQSPARKLDFIFVGSSRVQAAVNAETFAATAAPHLGRTPTAANFGRGSSTLMQHYWGVRSLIAAAPQRFAGSVVFVEAVEGIPVHSFPYETPYVNGQPQLIIPVLQSSDLGAFWQTQTPTQTKAVMTAQWFLRGSQALTHRQWVGESLVKLGSDAFVKLGRRLNYVQTPQAAAPAMSEGGGIKLDPEAMRAAADFAQSYTAAEFKNQQPLRDWDETVIHALVQTVQQAGGRVIFFNVPMHSLMAAPSQTPTRIADRQHFAAVAAQWQTPLLTADFHPTDSDFPDVWHLSLAKAKPYTQALAKAYLALNP